MAGDRPGVTSASETRPSQVATAEPVLPPAAFASPSSGFPPLPPSPEGGPAARALSRASRSAFRVANRWAMVPFHRAGLAAWLGNPLTGWQLLLTTRGRKSGLRRPTPLGYLVADGAAWVLAGYGPSTLWYRNLVADPDVEILLPARAPLPARATDVLDPAVRARIIPPLVRSMALPGTMVGCLPWSAPDQRILELAAWIPLIRLAPADGSLLVAGPDDPGGLGWTWRSVAGTLATVIAVRVVWRGCGR